LVAADKKKTTDKLKVVEKPLTATMEDYLEAIYDLDKDKKVVRVKDIAKRLDVKMPTVTSALKTLNERGLVHYEKYEYVELTTEGTAVGHEMHRRHVLLLKFLTDILKIDFQTADEEACKMEHALSVATLERLADFMSFVQECPRAGESWLNHFETFRIEGQKPAHCATCTDTFACDVIEQAVTAKRPKRQPKRTVVRPETVKTSGKRRKTKKL
jgi:DtxR family transcriptional regulator, Mn-dependent transcriptional regulator